jgi:hypothetical protein
LTEEAVHDEDEMDKFTKVDDELEEDFNAKEAR